MNNFDWTSFTKNIAIKAPLIDIYNAWTNASELEKWFLEQAIFTDENGTVIDLELNVTAGCTYNWFWYLYEDPMLGIIKKANGKYFLMSIGALFF